MAILALIGGPGTGKSRMAYLTAPRRPVHVVDIDRKVRAMPIFKPALDKGELTYKEIGDTIAEGGLKRRMDALVKAEKMDRPPLGWTNFANYIQDIEKDENFIRAGTLVVDSYTILAQHARAHIQYMRGHSKFVWDEWSIWKAFWTETTTILIDTALAHNKDLIIIVHERVSEIPGDQTTRVVVTNKEGGKQREYQGTMDVKIAASIEGSFGLEFGAYFTDFYALDVVVDKDRNPTWKCRVLPEGQRDLRCSFDIRDQTGKVQAVWDPDLSKIWARRTT